MNIKAFKEVWASSFTQNLNPLPFHTGLKLLTRTVSCYWIFITASICKPPLGQGGTGECTESCGPFPPPPLQKNTLLYSDPYLSYDFLWQLASWRTPGCQDGFSLAHLESRAQPGTSHCSPGDLVFWLARSLETMTSHPLILLMKKLRLRGEEWLLESHGIGGPWSDLCSQAWLSLHLQGPPSLGNGCPFTHSQSLGLGLACSRHLISTREIDLKSTPRRHKGRIHGSWGWSSVYPVRPPTLSCRGLLGIPREKKGLYEEINLWNTMRNYFFTLELRILFF